jgi:hypothetical protein
MIYKEELKMCPRCNELKDMKYPALSREDDKTEICTGCGAMEALQAFADRELKEKGG